MEKPYSVRLSRIVREHKDLKVVFRSADFDAVRITTADLNRPGLQLMGYYDYFEPSRPQIIGKAETFVLKERSPEERRDVFRELFSRKVPMLVVCHNQEIFPECLEMAEKYDVTVLTTEFDTSEFYAQLIGTLRRYLAPRETIHGGLVEVHGEGLLIIGDSGIGKSETALELIKRGHRFIADDAVEILRTSRTTLVGRAPELIRGFMELRGIGVVDIRNIYGVGAVKESCPIDLVVRMLAWEEVSNTDRLGLETEETSYLDVPVPIITIPVRPGRNLAVILEMAAMNNRQKRSGYNAAERLAERVDSHAEGFRFSGESDYDG